VHPPGGPPAPPPTGPVAHATGPVAQRSPAALAPPATLWRQPAPGGALDPAALALGSGLAAPDGAGGLRFAAPGDPLTGAAGDRPSGGTEQLGGAAAGPVQRLDAAAAGPVDQLAAVNGQLSQLAAAATGPVNQLAAANGQLSQAVAVPAAAAAASAGAGTADLDDLARRLYDRLRSRLMAELRLDRERAGFVTDLRH
jgi:hypothetical protein